MNIFLDDIRMPYEVGNYIFPVALREQYRKEEWMIVRNYEEFCEAIEQCYPHISKISFDHDLATIHYCPSTWTEGFEYEEETGLDCAKFLINYWQNENDAKVAFPLTYIHSMNIVGAENIKNLLNNYLKYENKD